MVKVITNQQIIEKISELEVVKIHFEGLLLHNDREMNQDEIQTTKRMLHFISVQVDWLRQNL